MGHFGKWFAIGLRNVEDVGGTKCGDNAMADAFGLGILAVDLVAVDDGCEDGNALLALEHVSSHFLPAPIAGNSRGVGALQGDEQAVAPRVRMESALNVEPLHPLVGVG